MELILNYKNLNFLRFSILDPDAEVQERIASFRDQRYEFLEADDRTGEAISDNGYESTDTITWDHHEEDEDENIVDNQYDVDVLMQQLGWMDKIDKLSNKVLNVGVVSGTVTGIRGAADWQDYVLINSLSETLKLSIAEGTLILKTFREILTRHQVVMFIPSTMRCIKERCAK